MTLSFGILKKPFSKLSKKKVIIQLRYRKKKVVLARFKTLYIPESPILKLKQARFPTLAISKRR